MLKLINRFAKKTLDQYSRGISGCQTIIPGQGATPLTLNDNTLVNMNVSWAYICAERLSKRVAQIPLRLYATRAVGEQKFKTPHIRPLGPLERIKLYSRLPTLKSHQAITAQDVVEITQHPFIDLLNNMNGWHDQFETFEETQQFIDTTGDGYWMKDRDKFTGLPTSLWLMPSQNVAIVPSKTKFIAGYLFGCDPESKRPTKDTIGLLPENVVHFRRPNLKDPRYGMGCLEAVVLAHELNQEAQRYNKALNKNMGVPSIIATFKDATAGDMTINKFKRTLNKVMQGVDKAGRTFVTTGEMDIKVVGLSQREMSFLNGQRWTRTEICDAYGVPLALVDTENVNRANAEAATYQFEAFAIKPRLKKLSDKINSGIIPDYNEPRIFCAFDENVPEDNTFELERTIKLFVNSVTTRDEARASQNLPLLGPENGGDDFIVIGGAQVSGAGDGGNITEATPDEDTKYLLEKLQNEMREIRREQQLLEA